MLLIVIVEQGDYVRLWIYRSWKCCICSSFYNTDSIVIDIIGCCVYKMLSFDYTSYFIFCEGMPCEAASRLGNHRTLVMFIWNIEDCIERVFGMGNENWIPRGWTLEPLKGEEDCFFEEMEIFMKKIRFTLKWTRNDTFYVH